MRTNNNMKHKKIKYIDSNLINDQTDFIAKPEIITSIGFVIKETDDYITITREIVGEEYRGQLSIPKVAIL